MSSKKEAPSAVVRVEALVGVNAETTTADRREEAKNTANTMLE